MQCRLITGHPTAPVSAQPEMGPLYQTSSHNTQENYVRGEDTVEEQRIGSSAFKVCHGCCTQSTYSCGHLHKFKPVKNYSRGLGRCLTKDPGQHHHGGSHNQTPVRVFSNHSDDDN